jgi:hypothetical protein
MSTWDHPTIPQPDWWDKGPDQWPEDAREFYRLCHMIYRRVLFHRQYGKDTSCPDPVCRCRDRNRLNHAVAE